MPRTRPFSSGFTLIEVMMAATILLVGFIGLIQAVTIGSEMIDTSRKQVLASQIINGEIEALRMSTWSTITGMSSSGTITINSTGTAVSNNTTRFALTNFTSSASDDNTALISLAKSFTVSYTKTAVRTDFYKLVYTVTWTGNTGRAFTRTGEAYFGKNGLQLSYQKS